MFCHLCSFIMCFVQLNAKFHKTLLSHCQTKLWQRFLHQLCLNCKGDDQEEEDDHRTATSVVAMVMVTMTMATEIVMFPFLCTCL